MPWREKRRAGQSSKINEQISERGGGFKKEKSEHRSPKRVRSDSAEPGVGGWVGWVGVGVGSFPLEAGLPVATGEFRLAQTERRRGRRTREEAERGKPALLSYRGNRKRGGKKNRDGVEERGRRAGVGAG